MVSTLGVINISLLLALCQIDDRDNRDRSSWTRIFYWGVLGFVPYVQWGIFVMLTVGIALSFIVFKSEEEDCNV